jgi:hypothetical protein
MSLCRPILAPANRRSSSMIPLSSAVCTVTNCRLRRHVSVHTAYQHSGGSSRTLGTEVQGYQRNTDHAGSLDPRWVSERCPSRIGPVELRPTDKSCRTHLMNPGHRYCMKQLHLTFGSTPALSSRLRRYQDSHKGLQIDPPSSNRAIVQAFYVESLRDVIHIPKLVSMLI